MPLGPGAKGTIPGEEPKKGPGKYPAPHPSLSDEEDAEEKGKGK